MKKILLFVFISLILLIVIIFVNLFSFRPLDFELEDVKKSCFRINKRSEYFLL